MTSSTGRSGGSHALSQRNGTNGTNNLGAVPFAKTRPVSKSSGNSQADQRRAHFMTDQHGRPWSCSIELKSGMPTGLIANDFHAPWLPEQNALVVNPNNTSELWIDYGLMWRERMQALSAYHKNAVALAVDKNWPVPTKGVYSNDFRRVLQDPPKPLQPVKAAAQENPWILGFTDVIDERLYEYVTPLEDRDTDLDDGEDYSPDGFAEQVAQQEGATLDDDAVEERGPRAPVPFVRPVLDLADMQDDSVGDYRDGGDDDGLGVQGTDTPSDEDDDAYAPRFPAEEEGPEESALAVLDETHDDGFAGRTIPPQKAALAHRQAPRSPSATSKTRKKGKSRGSTGSKGRTMASLRQRQAAQGQTGTSGKSLADGARPAVGAARSAGEVLVRHTSEVG